MSSTADRVARAVSHAIRSVAPIKPTNAAEDRITVLRTYKKCQRLTPKFWWDFGLHDMPLSVIRAAIKKQFTENAHLTDIRIVDRLVGEADQSSSSDKWLGIPFDSYDVLISDVGEEQLKLIGSDNKVEHLARGSFSDNPFPVKGRLHGINQRLMVPLVCRYNVDPTAKPHNVWFLVDTGSPYTCLTVKSLEKLVGKGFTRDLHSLAIQIPTTNIECHLSKAHFSGVNVLGMNALRRLRISIDVDWDDDTFMLIRK